MTKLLPNIAWNCLSRLKCKAGDLAATDSIRDVSKSNRPMADGTDYFVAAQKYSSAFATSSLGNRSKVAPRPPDTWIAS